MKKTIGLIELAIGIILAAIILFLLGGCRMTEATLPDGSQIRRCGFLIDESFSVSYDEGSFTIDGYKSETAEIVGAAVRAAVKP